MLAAIETGRGFYLDVALAWAVLCLVAALALAKHLEGRGLDE